MYIFKGGRERGGGAIFDSCLCTLGLFFSLLSVPCMKHGVVTGTGVGSLVLVFSTRG